MNLMIIKRQRLVDVVKKLKQAKYATFPLFQGISIHSGGSSCEEQAQFAM